MARSKKRWLIAGVIILAAVTATVAARSRTAGSPDEDKGPDIPVLAASIDDVQVVVREIGTVEPEIKVDIKSNLSGRVVDLPIRPGDRVEKGQLIARIEPDVNQAQDLLAVKNRVSAARINLEDANEDYEAQRKLFESGLISVELHRQAEIRVRQMQQDLDAAQEKITVVEASGIPVGDNPQQVVNITSPMSGIIIDRPVELGETVTGSGSFNAGTVIATVADLATMQVKAGINEVDIGKIHEGQEVRVSLDAYARKVFPGSISRIAPAARMDNQVKVFDIEIALDELSQELRTGMTANIEIRGAIRNDVLTVPVESVFIRGEEEIVYVKLETPLPAESTDSTDETDPTTNEETAGIADPWQDDPRQLWRRWFEERQVVTGIASTTDVQITTGLAEGEKVALADPSKPQEERS